MIALITGMKGFAGTHLAEFLASKGEQPVSLDLDTVNLLDAEGVAHTIKALNPDRVYHLAAESSVAESWKDPESFSAVNVQGTVNLLKAVTEHAKKARMLMVSTGEIYGKPGQNDLPLKEDSPLAPLNPYSLSKLHAEIECEFFSRVHGIDVRRVRPLGHTGPGQRLGFVVPDLASQAAAIALGKAGPEIRVGRLDVSREFIDVRDVVRAYWMIMEKGDPGSVYNLSANRPHTIKEVATTLMEIAQIEARLSPQTARLRPTDLSTPRLDTSKISGLGFSFQVPFRKTMADVLMEWMEKIEAGRKQVTGPEDSLGSGKSPD